MRKTRTIAVEELRQMVNKANRYPESEKYNNQAIRSGANKLLEMALMRTGNYEGYVYYRQDELEGRDTHPDDSRRHYLGQRA